MRKLISMAAVSAAATLGLLAPAQAAQAAQADPGGQLLGNTATGLCVTRTAGPVDPPRPAYTAPCTGASTQRWVYSAAENTIRTPGAGWCLATGSTSGVAVAACDSGLLIHWELTADGRIHQLDWGIGCLDDVRSQYLTWGPCDAKADEVWSLSAA